MRSGWPSWLGCREKERSRSDSRTSGIDYRRLVNNLVANTTCCCLSTTIHNSHCEHFLVARIRSMVCLFLVQARVPDARKRVPHGSTHLSALLFPVVIYKHTHQLVFAESRDWHSAEHTLASRRGIATYEPIADPSCGNTVHISWATLNYGMVG